MSAHTPPPGDASNPDPTGQRPAPAASPAEPRRSLMFNLGAFFGHIAHAVKADVRPERTVLREETTHEHRQTPVGNVTLRRTVIEEMRVEREGTGN